MVAYGDKTAEAQRMSDEGRTGTDLGIMASQLLFAVECELFERLHQCGFQEIVPRHRPVLAHLSADGVRATDLAHRSGRMKQVIGVIIDDLETLECVERRPDPADRRAKLIVPTARGKRQMDAVDAIMASIMDRHAQMLGVARFDSFLADFRVVIQHQQPLTEFD